MQCTIAVCQSFKELSPLFSLLLIMGKQRVERNIMLQLNSNLNFGKRVFQILFRLSENLD